MFTYPFSFNRAGVAIPFNTTLYTGNGSTQNINTGKNNSAGSLIWIKSRSSTTDNSLFDTVSGTNKYFISNSTSSQSTTSGAVTAFNSNGFSIGNNPVLNTLSSSYVAWSFLESLEFFDIVNYTGTGSARTISHSLGVVPGCIIIKNKDRFSKWIVGHRKLANGVSAWNNTISLNETTQREISDRFNNTAPTSSVFSLHTTTADEVNRNGDAYTAYLFAHNPELGISCDSFFADGSGNATVNLGWKPQFIIAKAEDFSGDWVITDKKRGVGAVLKANTSASEVSTPTYTFTSTGFTVSNVNSSQNYIYIAIRDGV